jgi:hypothetical protein
VVCGESLRCFITHTHMHTHTHIHTYIRVISGTHNVVSSPSKGSGETEGRNAARDIVEHRSGMGRDPNTNHGVIFFFFLTLFLSLFSLSSSSV